MRAHEFLEALKPSQYRHLVKGWDKAKYADLFGDKYRIYLPLATSDTPDQPIKFNPQVSQEVEKAGYKIDDYVKGIASKNDNGRVRQIKIGKLLSPTTAQKFANDPIRQATKQVNQLVVISRHPYDIAGMSTDRGWTSCMNLTTVGNKRYVPLDIAAGTVIAYLIDADDKNIQHPKARMLIKPFVNMLGNHEVAFGIENRVYGTAPAAFSKTVSDWVNKINASRQLNGIFELDPRLYQDDLHHPQDDEDDEGNRPTIALGPHGTSPEMLKNPIQYVKDHPDADDALLKTLVSYNPYTIQYIKNPSRELQLIAANKNIVLFKYVQDPPPELQLKAVSANGEYIQYIDNPSHQVQMTAVKKDAGALKYIANPSHHVQMAAVTNNGNAIAIIDNPSLDLQMAAVKSYPDSINRIKNPAPQVIALANTLRQNKDTKEAVDEDAINEIENLQSYHYTGGKNRIKQTLL